MSKEYSVNHIQILRLAYFAELRYLLTFSGEKTDASLRLKFPYHFMERGERAWREPAVRLATSTTQQISLMCGL